jgi:2-(1,2-epoxy-1,2-dihydrophenyl)acetyl-CoA isomerase
VTPVEAGQLAPAARTPAGNLIDYHEAEGVGILTLTRSERLNTMTAGLLDAVLARLEAAASDDSLRVLVLTGSGRGFCAGGDLAEGLRAINGDPPQASQTRRLRTYMRTTQLLHDMPAVTVAAINGACAGAGLAWAAACDLRYAAAQARFSTAFIGAGVSGDFGGTWTLPRIVGGGLARELYFTGRRFDSDEALRMGFVSEVVPDGELMAHVAGVACTLASAAPLALRAIKANMIDAERLSLSAHLDVEAERHSVLCESADAREAAAAFLEKRRPVFVGR